MTNPQIFLGIAFCVIPFNSAKCASNYQFYVNRVNTSDGIGNPAAGSAWAVIYDDNNDNLLPGGLADGTSLTIASGAAIRANFGSFSIAAGTVLPNGDRILSVGSIELSGLINQVPLAFNTNLNDASVPGRRFGVYWFPGRSVGQILDTTLGSFQIGGFLELSPHVPSGGQAGMIVPVDAAAGAFLAYDAVDGPFSAERLNAVIIPEPTSFLLSTLGLAALLRRSRRA